MSKDKDIKPYQIYLDNEHKQPASPVTKGEYVTLEGGQNVEDFLSSDIKNGVAEGVTNDLKLDSASFNGPVDITIKGNTIQNILPKPSSEFITHNEPEFDLEDGPLYPNDFKPVAVNGKLEDLQIQGQTLKNLAFKTSPAEYESSGESDTFKTNLTGLDKDKYGLQDEYDYAVIKGQTVINHLAETCGTPAKTHTNERDIIPDVNSPLAIETCDGFFHEAKLYGKTLKNELVPHGTEVNTIKHTERHNDGLGTELQDNADYDVAILQGKTLVNYIQDDTSADDYVAFDNDYEGTNITISDTIDGNIQKAVLEGKTLVNLAPSMRNQTSLTANTTPWALSGSGQVAGTAFPDANKLKIAPTIDGSMIIRCTVPNTMKENTKYFVQLEFKNNSNHTAKFYKISKEAITLENGLNKFVITTVNDFESDAYMGIALGNTGGVAVGTEFEFSNLMVIEYQEGMENWDIPYFEGMQSVTVSTRIENLCHRGIIYDTKTGATFTSGSYDTRIAHVFTTSEVAQNFKPATRYMVQFKVSNLVLDGLNEIILTMSEGTIESNNSVFGTSGSQQIQVTKNGIYRRIVTTSEVYSTSNFSIKGWADQWENSNPISSTRTLTISDIMCIEYQEGMENWDLEYFEDYQVVNPVKIKSINKNLFDGTIQNHYWNAPFTNGVDTVFKQKNADCLSTGRIKVYKNKTYKLSGNNLDRNVITFFKTDRDEELPFGGISNTSFTSTFDGYIEWYIKSSAIDSISNIQIEESDTATSYIAHQSKTISATEPVTLRAIGDIKDTLDLRTGEYIQRIKEIVLNGDNTYRWSINENASDTAYKYFMSNTINDRLGATNVPMKCDSLPVITHHDLDGKINDIGINLSYFIRLNFKDCNSNNGATVDDLKAYLNAHPVRIQYAIAEPIVSYIPLDSPILKTYSSDRTHLDTVCLDGTLKPSIHVNKEVSYNAIMAPSQEYTLYMTRTNNPETNMHVNIGGTDVEVLSTDEYYKSVTTPSTITDFTVSYYGHKHKLKEVMLISPKAEDENLDYFMGMQSVVNPKIISTGKNIVDWDNPSAVFNGMTFSKTDNVITVSSDGEITYPHIRYNIPIKHIKGKYVTLSASEIISSEPSLSVERVQLYGFDNHWPSISSNYLTTTVYIPHNFSDDYLKVQILTDNTDRHIASTLTIKNLQLEISDTPTEYESEYKSNTTTIPIQLNSLPNGVRDELDLNTGLYIKRIKEIIISSDYTGYMNKLDYDLDNTLVFAINLDGKLAGESNGIIDKLICLPGKYSLVTYDLEAAWFSSSSSHAYVRVKKSELEDLTLESFKVWLKSNPLRIQYELETPIVLTPDDANYPDELKSVVKPKQYSTTTILLSSDQLKPNLKYSLKTTNYYDIQGINNSDTYTTYNITGSFLDQTNLTTNYTGLLNRGVTKRVVVNGANPMVVKGQKINDLPYFTGLANFKTKAIELSDGSTGYEVVRNTGKNLVKWPSNIQLFRQYKDLPTNKDAEFSVEDNYKLILTGFNSPAAEMYIHSNICAYLIAGKTYTVSFKTDGEYSDTIAGSSSSGTDTVEIFLALDNIYNTEVPNNKRTFFRVNSRQHTVSIIKTGYYYIRFDLNKGDATHSFYDIQIEEGSTATTYEPYFENTVYVDEELELRSLPDGTCDELDLNTGILTRRVGHGTILADHVSSNWTPSKYTDGYSVFVATSGSTPDIYRYGYNNYSTSPYYTSFNGNTGIVGIDGIGYDCIQFYNAWHIQIENSDISFSGDIISFKNYIKKNPIYIQYRLSTPIREKIELKTRGNYTKAQISRATNKHTSYTKYFSSYGIGIQGYHNLNDNYYQVGFSEDFRFKRQGMDMPMCESLSFYTGGMMVSLDNNKLKDTTLGSANEYFALNPFTIYYKKANLVISETDISKPVYINKGHLVQSSNVACDIKYSLPNINYYYLRDLKPNTTYTMKYASNYTINNVYVGGNTYTTGPTIDNYYALANGRDSLPSMYEGTPDVKITTDYIYSSCYNVGDSVIKNTGKNLLDTRNLIKNGGMATCIYEDGKLTITGGNSEGTESILITSGRVYLEYGKTYTFSCKGDIEFSSVNGTDTLEGFLLLNGSASTNSRAYRVGENTTFVCDKEGIYWLRFDINNGIATHSVWDIQIEEGSTATEYEPYRENIITTQLVDKLQLRSLPNGTCDTFNAKTGIITRWVGVQSNKYITVSGVFKDVYGDTTILVQTHIDNQFNISGTLDDGILCTNNIFKTVSSSIGWYGAGNKDLMEETNISLGGASENGVIKAFRIQLRMPKEWFSNIDILNGVSSQDVRYELQEFIRNNLDFELYYPLETPTYETISMTNSNPDNDVFANGHTELTNNGVSPKLMYGLKTTKYANLPTLKPGKYTISTENTNININGTPCLMPKANYLAETKTTASSVQKIEQLPENVHYVKHDANDWRTFATNKKIKGRTLTNLSWLNDTYETSDISGMYLPNLSDVSRFKAGTTYTVFFKIKSNYKTNLNVTNPHSIFRLQYYDTVVNDVQLLGGYTDEIFRDSFNNRCFTFTMPEDMSKVIFMQFMNRNSATDFGLTELTTTVKDICILEGDYSNKPRPYTNYFTGTLSVTNPTIKFTGRNLFSVNKFFTGLNIHGQNMSNNCITIHNDSSFTFKTTGSVNNWTATDRTILNLKSNTTYVVSYNCNVKNGESGIYLRNEENGYFDNVREGKNSNYGHFITDKSGMVQFGFRVAWDTPQPNGVEITFSDIALVEVDKKDIDKYGSVFNTITSEPKYMHFEPYEECALTYDGITLRSNGDVCDELDIDSNRAYAKIIRRIAEDGSILENETIEITPYLNMDLSSIDINNDTMIHVSGSNAVIPQYSYTPYVYSNKVIELETITTKDVFNVDINTTIVEGENINLVPFSDVSTVNNAKVKFTDSEGRNATTIDLSGYALNSLPNGVHDAIDIKNGYHIQRVRKIVLDGSRKWTQSIGNESMNKFYTPISNLRKESDYSNSIIAIGLNTVFNNTTTEYGIITGYNDNGSYPNDNWLYLRINKDMISVNDLKQYLSSNPVTVYYELKDYILTPIEELQLPNVYKGGKVQITADSVLPKVKYKYPTNNSYVVDKLLPNTTYTLRTNSANDFYIGGTLYDRSSGGKYEFKTSSNLINRFMVFKGSVQADACNPCILVGSSSMYPLIPNKIDNLTVHAPYLDSDKCLIRTTSKNLFDISRMKEVEYTGEMINISHLQNVDINMEDNSVTTRIDNIFHGGLGYRIHLEPHKQYIIHLDFKGDGLGFFNISGVNCTNHYGQRIGCKNTDTNSHYYRVISTNTGWLQLSCTRQNGTYAKFSNIAIYEYNDDTTEVYEPFHSHITELYDEYGNDIELLSIPGTDVRDELIIDNDYRTARLIKRIGKIQLDGSEKWTIGTDGRYIFYLNSSIHQYKPGGHVVDDLFSRGNKYDINSINISIGNSQFIQLSYDPMRLRQDTRTGTDSMNIIKRILAKYKPTIYYELDKPQVTELQMTLHPVAHTNGHILLETKNPALIESVYPINQTAQIDDVNSMIAEHDVTIDEIYELMGTYSDALTLLLMDKAVLEYVYEITDDQIQEDIANLESDTLD